MTRTIYYTATIVTLDGSDTNAYGEPCEPGHGYTEHSGWWSPDFDLWSVHPDRDEAEPDRYPAWADMPAAQWLAARLVERLGPVGHVEDHTFYAAGEVIARPGQRAEVRAPQVTALGRADPAGTRTLTAAAHAHGFTEQELRDAAGLLGLTPISTAVDDTVAHRLTSPARRGFTPLASLSPPAGLTAGPGTVPAGPRPGPTR